MRGMQHVFMPRGHVQGYMQPWEKSGRLVPRLHARAALLHARDCHAVQCGQLRCLLQ